MAESDDDRIRRRAYLIWEEEGRPWGRDDEHWQRAAREIAEMLPAAPPIQVASVRKTAKVESNGAAEAKPVAGKTTKRVSPGNNSKSP